MSMISLWKVSSNYDLGIFQERSPVNVLLPLAPNFNDIEVELISGSLPRGTRLENNMIIGTAFEVAVDTVYKFVLRATQMENFEDRTFVIKIVGPDEPKWQTPEGLLSAGANGNRYFVLDNEPIDFQLFATDTDLPAGDSLEYFIAEGEGELPPGLTLSSNGRITGISEPLLSLDKRFKGGQYDTQPYGNLPFDFYNVSSNGFSSYFYDSQVYDFSTATQSLRKLNRYFPFIATVTDGDTFVKRQFQIYLVGDDFLRSDNDIMQAANGVFTADNTYVRAPIWITPSDLGFKRANNYLTIPLQVLDSPTLTGTVTYILEDFNDDGSPSILPPGMILDSADGYIHGRVPYQPAITRDYKFTVNAIRIDSEFELLEIFGIYFEDVLVGNKTFKINKLDSTGVADGIRDARELRNRYISINNRQYLVTSVDTTNSRYEVLTVDRNITPEINLILSETASIGQSHFFVQRLQESEKNKYQSRTLSLSNTERYVIDNIIPYLEYEIYTDLLSLNSQDIAEIESYFGGKVYLTQSNSRPDLWVLKLNSTINTRNVNNVRTFLSDYISINDIKLTKDNEDRIEIFNQTLSSRLIKGRNVGIALFENDSFSRILVIASEDETTRPSKTKTFELRVIGEVDSNVSWITPNDLGVIPANFVSTLKLEAESVVPESQMIYTLKSGSLPNGLRLNYRGEIIGTVKQFADNDSLGLTAFDNSNTTFDTMFSYETTFDREFTFVVEARDRFGFVAIDREFTVKVEDFDNTLYTDLYVKPFLKPETRREYQKFINDPEIFDRRQIFRYDDPNFGIQKEIKALVYAGIEAKELGEFVAATTKNHTRKRFRIGELKSAIAREPGTRDTVYEVVYIELIDPYNSKNGNTASSFKIKNSRKITVDSVQYETNDDSTGLYNSESIRNRPLTNTIKTDNTAIKASTSLDQTRYISNISNMRENIKRIGKNEREYLPLWMRTPQGDYQELDYVAAIPICFCNPGSAAQIILNIKNNNFNFKQIDFDIDRYIIKKSKNSTDEQYILFANYQFNI